MIPDHPVWRCLADPSIQEPASYARNWGSGLLVAGGRAVEAAKLGVRL